jgi:hypothetical protein
MATAPSPRKQDVAYIAGQFLSARRDPGELAEARNLLPQIHPLDTFETERLEVLRGAIECLESPVRERARAARYLLQQLANVEACAVSR